MHPNSKDITGQKSGRLTIIRPTDERRNGCIVWECLCLCGNKCFVSTESLRRKRTRSCGCLRRDLVTTHGMWGTSIYKIWAAMIQRCENPKDPAYKYYGGRGIKVCERWHVFENFYADVGDPPTDKSLDRWPNNDGNYEPNNWRWATAGEQVANSRPNSCGPNKQRWFCAWYKDSMAQFINNNQCEFARKYRLKPSGISRCLHGKQKQYKGWMFRFLEVNI